jgi:hypothetical protein
MPNTNLQEQSRSSLITEMHQCLDIIHNISDVKIYGKIKNSNDRIDTIDLVDYFTNFPFHWLTEIKVILSDAVSQYEQLLNDSQDGI